MRILQTFKQLKCDILIAGAFFIPLLNTTMIYDHFSVIKWFAVNTLAVLALLHLMTFKKLPKPELPKWIWVTLALSALIFITHLIQGHTRLINFPLVDRLSILILCYYFYAYFKEYDLTFESLFYPTVASTLIVCIYGFYQVSIATGASSDFSSTFGNTNMTGQFLGFSILIQLFGKPFKEKNFTKLEILRLAIFAISVVYLTLLMCRSIYLGLILCTPFLFLKNRPSKAFTFCAIAGLSLALGLFLRAKPAEALQKIKVFEVQNETTKQRWVMWRQSLRQLQDTPFGIGPAGYEFGSIPYMINTESPPKEDLVFKSPHNEFLRFAVEDGVPFVLLMTAFWIWLLMTKLKQRPWSNETVFCAVFAILWLTEMSVQFPFENAYPSFLISIMGGYVLANRPLANNIQPMVFRTIGALLLATMIFVLTPMMHAKYLEGKSTTNPQYYQKACELYPDNWRPCINYARYSIDLKNWINAEETLRDILQRTPYNFAALKLWGVMAYENKYHHQGCTAIWIYDQIFSGKSSMHSALNELCSSYAEQLSSIGLYQLYPKPLPKLEF